MKPDEHYDYRFQDHSLILRLTEKRVFTPLVRLLPRRLTPNQITIAGQLAALTGFLVVVLRPSPSAISYLALAGTILFYTVADCIDGLHARATKQTSRLGELLDHWLDAISVPLVVLALGLAWAAPAWLVVASVAASGFLHFATFVHGFRAGFVHLGAIGMLEGTCIGAAAGVVSALAGPELFSRALIGEFSLAALLLASLLAGALFSLYAMRSLVRHARDFLLVGTLLGTLGLWFAFGKLPAVSAGLLVIAISSRLEGVVLRARLVRAPFVLRDPLLVTFVVAGTAASLVFDLSAGLQILLGAAATAYGFARGAADFLRTVAELRAPIAARQENVAVSVS
jgi:phosphatidylglycerophosphate synthase